MKPRSIHQLLQSFSLFQNLSEMELELLASIAIHRSYPEGTHIFMQGETLKNVYFIHRGQIKIYRTDLQGKEQIINILQSGEMFPHQGFFRGGTYPAHAVSMDNSTLIYIPIQAFEQFLLKNPEICMKIFRVLGEKIVDLQNRLEEKVLHNTREQIILLLIRIAKNHGVKIADGKTLITTNFTNRELANMIGTSRETMNRTLAQLKKKQIVSTNENGQLLMNVENLKDELF